jgi:dTMP kinase
MQKQKRGIFITIEKTGDGLGGTTQSRLLYENLKRLGLKVRLTKEPGGATTVGHDLRTMVLNPSLDLAPATVLFLLMADRAQHYYEVLRPSLEDGYFVISDRYYDSTLAYQSQDACGGWKTDLLDQLHHAATDMLIPDLTFVLDGIPHRSRGQDRFEKMDDLFYERVRNKMLELAHSHPRYCLLNANIPQVDLSVQIFDEVKKRFPEYFS